VPQQPTQQQLEYIQQQLDHAFIINLSKQMKDCKEETYKEAFGNKDWKIQCAAIIAASNHGTKYKNKLIEFLSDKDENVSQTARGSLIRISFKTRKKEIDFGPLPNSSQQEREGSIKMWQEWFKK
jgi:hypothetical protein